MCINRLTSLILVYLTATALPLIANEAESFFDAHCYSCHDSDSQKGNLDLEALSADMSSLDDVDLWTRIHDRVKNGEMPPKKKKRPQSGELKQYLGWLAPRLTKADKKHREVVHRRLNRVEYENTINDLLGVRVYVKELLPEDQQAGGFDNNGRALAVSAEHLPRYLEASRRAIDAAVEDRPKPRKIKETVDSIHETKRYYKSGLYSLHDGRVYVYNSNRSTYAKISTRRKRIPEDGYYRFTFDAVTTNTEQPIVFSVVSSDFGKGADFYDVLSYHEATDKPQKFVIEGHFRAQAAIQFFLHGRPGWIKDPVGKKEPGVGFGPITITGPHYNQWPPRAHQNLFGNLNLAKATASEIRPILARFMPRAFRRPVSSAEVDRYEQLVRARLTKGQTFLESIRVGLQAILCSPNFLYLQEQQTNNAFITDHELAARLSYFLWSSGPDAELTSLANKKHLHKPEILAAQFNRLVADPKAERFVTNFTGQWLKLREIDATTPDVKLYRSYDELLKVSMLDESTGFFKLLLDKNLPISNFLDSDFAYLNERLAKHYDVPGVKGLNMRRVNLPKDSVRGGVATQAAVLKVTANGTSTSPVVRGVWVLENLLGIHPPPPPPNVSGIEPDIRGAETIREKLAKHRDNTACAACHQKIDPPGFALESFDPIGSYREHYLRWKVTNAEKGWGSILKGAPVDASGITAKGTRFSGMRDFKKLLLADQDKFAHCLTEKLYAYGLGREMGFADRPAIGAVTRQASANGNGFKTLMRAVVTSDAFRRR